MLHGSFGQRENYECNFDLTSIIQQYGYLAIFVGAVIEGKSFLLLGGLAAYKGVLQLSTVVGTAAFGGFIGDQLCFGAGKHFGTRLVSRFPSLIARIGRIDRLVSRHPAFTVIMVRFLYGFRIAGPIAIGMTNMTWKRFSALNSIGAILWATIIVGLGYVLGLKALPIFENIRQFGVKKWQPCY